MFKSKCKHNHYRIVTAEFGGCLPDCDRSDHQFYKWPMAICLECDMSAEYYYETLNRSSHTGKWEVGKLLILEENDKNK